MKYFLVSDIHASYKELKELLEKHWNPKESILVLMGDYIDRGRENLKTIYYIIELKKKYGDDRVITLLGNHDSMILDYLNSSSDMELKYNFYVYNRLLMIETYNYDLKKFKGDSHKWRRKNFLYKHFEVYKFLSKLDWYFETEHFICVHAGYNPLYKDWKSSGRQDFIWIRNQFFEDRYPTPKKTFFGHTPTIYLHNIGHTKIGEEIWDEPNKTGKGGQIWINERGDKVGIDGGLTMGYQLNGVLIDEFGEILETYSVKSAEQ